MDISHKQPKALTILFLTEMWERFSFYGMRSLLVLYIIQHLNGSQTSAFKTFGAYAALVYLGGIFGGLVADKLLGFRRSIILGGVVISCGHFVLAIEHEWTLFLGLGLVVCGTSLFKSNITSFLGDFYESNDPRRQAGFSIFYMGINLGGLLAFMLCGYVATRFGWHMAFSLAGFGMLLGLSFFLWGQKYLEGKGDPACLDYIKKSYLGVPFLVLSYIVTFALSILIAYLIYNNKLLGNILVVIGALTFVYTLKIAFTGTKQCRTNILSLLVLMAFMLLFLAFWEQTSSSMTVFIEYNVDRAASWLEVVGIDAIPAPSFALLNSLFVILFAGVVGGAWVWLARLNKAPYAPMKFVISFIFLGSAFYVLSVATHQVQPGEMLSMGWIVLFYALYSIGELCIMPVGFALVTQLAPSNFRGFFMGAWFMAIAFAEYVAAMVAQLTTSDDALSETASMALYGTFFQDISYWTLGAAILLVLLSFVMRPVFARL